MNIFIHVYIIHSDAAVSSAVLIGLLGSMNGYSILDPMAGILVAGVIIKQVIYYIFPSLEYVFLIDFILYLCRSGFDIRPYGGYLSSWSHHKTGYMSYFS
jgi:hypothetical protein